MPEIFSAQDTPCASPPRHRKMSRLIEKDEKQHKKIHFRRAGFVTIKFPSHNVNSSHASEININVGSDISLTVIFVYFTLRADQEGFYILSEKK